MLEDALTGPASQFLRVDARKEQNELTTMVRHGEWQYLAVSFLADAAAALGIDYEAVPTKTNLVRWFRIFATIRNKTRSHGALTPTKSALAAENLHKSIDILCENFSLFKRPWAYLYRNLSGKYRVSPITSGSNSFDSFKSSSDKNVPNGVYVHFEAPSRVTFIESDPDLQDFFFANGGFNGKRYECLSYATDNRKDADAAPYQVPAGKLPKSETEGLGSLEPLGEAFSNLPVLSPDYVSRPKLEEDLLELLMDQRRLIVTLVGRGGIGKTSLALRVIPSIAKSGRFSVIIWLSARDVDLMSAGPKIVQPHVATPDEIAKFFARLILQPAQMEEKGFNARQYFENSLRQSPVGSILFIFDNFETVRDPVELFNWIDTYIRHPNKALITTRLRDFKGDYPVDVTGMEVDEARTLINRTASHLGISNLLRSEYIDDLIKESDGHPYVIKILLGELANNQHAGSIPKLVANRDEILTALFERTYASLTPCAQRAFLTLAGWNSAVSRLVLDAVLQHSTGQRTEVDNGISLLIRYSIAEVHHAEIPDQEIISLPLVASVFGRKKLNVSPSKSAIEADIATMRMLGPTSKENRTLGFAKRIETFIANVSKRVDHGTPYENFAPIVEMICRNYRPARLIVARWQLEVGTAASIKAASDLLSRYLEDDPSSSDAADAWRMLAYCGHLEGDWQKEIHAFVERAQIGSLPFSELSATAHRMNKYFHERSRELEHDEKEPLARRLLQVMDKRKEEASADDMSRMAWLSLHLRDKEGALKYATTGLKIEPDNYHCLLLQDRLVS